MIILLHVTTWLSAFPTLDAEKCWRIAKQLHLLYTIWQSSTDRLIAITASARLNYPMMMFSTAAVVVPSGMLIPETGNAPASTNRFKGQVGIAKFDGCRKAVSYR